jgi:phospholipid/cholesterol/gamma-HCH transport system substrate-binding protein
MKEKSIEVKVGALVIVCLALLVAFVLILGDFGGASGFPVAVDFETASDIKPGAPVKVAGVAAGKVKRIEFWGGKQDTTTGRRVIVRVQLDLDPDKGAALHKDAQFFISTQGILGEKYIEIDPGSFYAPALPKNAVSVGVPPLRMEVLGQQLTKVAGAITRILEDNEKVVNQLLVHADETVLETKKTVQDADKLIVDNRDDVRRTVEKLEKTADHAEDMLAKLQGAVGDGSKIKRTIDHVEAVAADVHAKSGPMLADAKATTHNVRLLTEKLRDKPTVDVLLGEERGKKVGGVVDRVDKSMKDVNDMTDNARAGKGTVGGLLMDNELFMDLKLLLKDLKRHPWKFIWRE